MNISTLLDENGFCDYERFQQVLSEGIKNGKK